MVRSIYVHCMCPQYSMYLHERRTAARGFPGCHLQVPQGPCDPLGGAPGMCPWGLPLGCAPGCATGVPAVPGAGKGSVTLLSFPCPPLPCRLPYVFKNPDSFDPDRLRAGPGGGQGEALCPDLVRGRAARLHGRDLRLHAGMPRGTPHIDSTVAFRECFQPQSGPCQAGCKPGCPPGYRPGEQPGRLAVARLSARRAAWLELP